MTPATPLQQRPVRPDVVAWLALLATLWIASGATCARRQVIPEFAPPVFSNANPTLPELTEYINRSLAIERLESNTMTISSPELATKLSGALAWERPHNFSLQAYPGTRLLGLAFAAGSNSREFWLQQQMGGPPTLYYAKHDDFENQQGPRQMLPVSPLWLREALGVVEIDPAMQHLGPRVMPGEANRTKLVIESFIPSPRGPYRRVLVLDAQTRTIEHTLLYDRAGAEGKLVAIAQQSQHQYYSAIDWCLPHHVDIQLQPDQGPPLAFAVDVEHYLLNEPASSDASAFRLPEATGLTTVNIAPGAGQAQAAVPVPPVYTQQHDGPSVGLNGYRQVR